MRRIDASESSDRFSISSNVTSQSSLRLFFSVGEPSGDLHGASLIEQLRRKRPDIECVGFGGPRMAAAGCHLHADLTQFAIMWFLRVLWHLPTFLRLLRQANSYFRQHRPDAVILIDFPGFNWWIARRAKALGIPVVYYGTPQIWAWAGWRIHKMRRLTDHVLCKLPFEADWFRQRGCNAHFVGHPYFDHLAQRPVDAHFVQELVDCAGPLVTLLPGSRTQEVTRNLPMLLRAVDHIHASVPDTRFAIASFNESQAELARTLAGKCCADVDVYTERTPELIRASNCCLACSGSVSLELLFETRPAVILYVIGRIPFFLQRYLRRVKFITLVNLLATDTIHAIDGRTYDPDAENAEQVPFPEYLTRHDKSREIANHVVRWLNDPSEWRARHEQLQVLRDQFAQLGATERAADYLLQHVRRPRPSTGQTTTASVRKRFARQTGD